MILDWLFSKKEDRVEGDKVDLVFERRIPPSSDNLYVPSVQYTIAIHGSSVIVGNIDLRMGMNEELYYAGNIGYHILFRYRGNGYAYEASKILLKLAYSKYEMDQLLITCSPDNIASRKTIEKLNGNLLETVDVPPTHWLYRRGETVKSIYAFDLAPNLEEE